MKQKRFSKKEKITLTVLVILMVAVLGVGIGVIVHNTNVANERATNTENTTISGVTLPTKAEINGDNDSTEIEATKKPSKKPTEKATEKTGEETTQKTTQKVTQKPTQKPTEATEATQAATKKPSPDAPISTVKPTTGKNHSSKEVCKINGKKFYVGDTVTATINIKTPKVLENYQGITEYSGEYLKCTGTKSNVNGVVNDNNGTIYYNGSDISTGFNFTKSGTIYTATFKVLKAGNAEIKNTIQILTDMNDKDVSVSKCSVSVNLY